MKINGKPAFRQPINLETTTAGWRDITVDLSRYAGRAVAVELINEPTGWRYEAAYWAQIAIETD